MNKINLVLTIHPYSLRNYYFQKGKGAPGREPAISEEEQKKMMAFYFKKQEEIKVNILIYKFLKLFTKFHEIKFQKLAEADDDTFLNSDWADNQALKRQFQGLKDIKWNAK